MNKRLSLIASIMILLAACGGSGGEDTPKVTSQQPAVTPLPPVETVLTLEDSYVIRSRVDTQIEYELSGEDLTIDISSDSDELSIFRSNEFINLYTSAIEQKTYTLTVSVTGAGGDVDKDVKITVDPSIDFQKVFVDEYFFFGCVLSDVYKGCWHEYGNTGPNEVGYTWDDVQSVSTDGYNTCYIIESKPYCSDVWEEYRKHPIDTSILPNRSYTSVEYNNRFLHEYGIVFLKEFDNGELYIEEWDTARTPISFRWGDIALLEGGGVACRSRAAEAWYADELCSIYNSVTSYILYDNYLMYMDASGYHYSVKPGYGETNLKLEELKSVIPANAVLTGSLSGYSSRMMFIDEDGYIVIVNLRSNLGSYTRTEIKAKKIVTISWVSSDFCYITEASRLECLYGDGSKYNDVPWNISTR